LREYVNVLPPKKVAVICIIFRPDFSRKRNRSRWTGKGPAGKRSFFDLSAKIFEKKKAVSY